MNVALVQFYSYHEEVLAPQIDFLHHDHKVFLLAPDSVFKNDYITFYKDKITKIIFKEFFSPIFSSSARKLSILLKYKTLFSICKKHSIDIIIFNTITKSFHYMLINLFFRKIKKIQIIHNASSVTNQGKIKDANIFLKSFFLSRDVYTNLLKNNGFNQDLFGWFCPLLNENMIQNKQTIFFDEKLINIVIPGSIDTQRRNYASLFDALKNYKHKNDLKFKIYLLGKASLQIQKLIANYDITNIVSSYNYFISGHDMLHCMKYADAAAFLIDSKLGAAFIDYNKYKISGTANLCLSFGTPCIVSEEYNIESSLRERSVSYPNDNICSILDRIQRMELTKDFFENLRSLPLEHVFSYENQKKQYLSNIGLLQWKI